MMTFRSLLRTDAITFPRFLVVERYAFLAYFLLSKKIHLSLAHNSVRQNPYEAIGLTKTVVVAIVKK